MVENLDFHVGRLIDHLKKIGEYENTIFIVFGDNGAEGTDLFKMIAGTPGTRDYLFAAINWSQTHPNAWGDPGSYVGYGPMWAQVSMTPFSQYKGWLGGRRHPQRAHRQRPGRQAAQGQHQPRPHARGRHHADAARDRRHAAIRRRCDGRELPPLMGKSWGPMLAGQAESPRTDQDYLAWELFGNRARAPGRLEAALAVQAATARATGSSSTSRPIPPSARTSPPSSPDKVQGAARALGRLRPGEQRDPAEPLAVRDAGRPAAAARPGRPGLPAAHLQAAVRAAEGHAGRARSRERRPIRQSHQRRTTIS